MRKVRWEWLYALRLAVCTHCMEPFSSQSQPPYPCGHHLPLGESADKRLSTITTGTWKGDASLWKSLGKSPRDKWWAMKQKNQEGLDPGKCCKGFVTVSSGCVRDNLWISMAYESKHLFLACMLEYCWGHSLPHLFSTPLRTNRLQDSVPPRSMREAQENSPSMQAKWKPLHTISSYPSGQNKAQDTAHGWWVRKSILPLR